MWTVPPPAEGIGVQTYPCAGLRSLHAQSLCAGHTNYKSANNSGSFTLKIGGKLSSPCLPGVG